jgi:hypothetical protein
MRHRHDQRPVEAPDVPAEEDIDLADAEEQLAEEPEEKTNFTERDTPA